MLLILIFEIFDLLFQITYTSSQSYLSTHVSMSEKKDVPASISPFGGEIELSPGDWFILTDLGEFDTDATS